MNNLKYKFLEFMRGRNGTDELYYAMFVLTIVLDIADVFVRSQILSILTVVLTVLTFFRFFSKNVYARQRENQKFLEIIGKFKNKDFSIKKNPYDVTPKKKSAFQKKIEAYKMRFRDRKTHVFKSCPECKVTLRLPKKKGEHTVCCPKCNTSFKVKVR